MSLYIGKNYKENTPAQSIFRLIGNDEDALTYALGFLLAHDQDFCAKLVRHLSIAKRHTLSPDYSIHLQEISDSGFGRRDIVIQDSKTRIVLEAKIGNAEPTAEQLLKYGAEHNLWNQYKRRGVIALTQVGLAAGTMEKISTTLSKQDIGFRNLQWHEVIDLIMNHRPSDGSGVSPYLFDEFIHYIRRDYSMGYFDAEILIQDVNPLNAEIFTEGWMYVTSPKDKKAPLYFAPYFTKQGTDSGISMISRVIDSEVVKLADKQGMVGDSPSKEHHSRWQSGLTKLRERAEDEGFANYEVRLFYLDRPIAITTKPITKSSFKKSNPLKQIPNQIPKGFSLRFDELVLPRPEVSGI